MISQCANAWAMPSKCKRFVRQLIELTTLALLVAGFAQQSAHGAEPPSLTPASCPGGSILITCGGEARCAPVGSTCCRGQICSPNAQVCLACSGSFACARPGSTCCGSDICAPGQQCRAVSGGRLACSGGLLPSTPASSSARSTSPPKNL